MFRSKLRSLFLRNRSPYAPSRNALRSYLTKYPHSSQWKVGLWSYGAPEIVGSGQAQLTIGNYTSIASNVKIYLGHEHNINWLTTYPFQEIPEHFSGANSITGHPFSKGDVNIGSDVWIGDDVSILSGVSIGDGAVIGAKSLVTNSVAPYAVVGGVPTRLIKYRFDQDTIHSLLKLRWWDWPEDCINSHLSHLCTADYQHLFDNTPV